MCLRTRVYRQVIQELSFQIYIPKSQRLQLLKKKKNLQNLYAYIIAKYEYYCKMQRGIAWTKIHFKTIGCVVIK